MHRHPAVRDASSRPRPYARSVLDAASRSQHTADGLRKAAGTESHDMALTAKLELRQGQQLVMTPQLQQAIRLLQLSNLELGQFVESELERNPLLEMEDVPEPVAKAERDAEPDSPSERAETSADDEWLD